MNIFEVNVAGYKNTVRNFCSQDFSIYKKYENYIVCAIADGHSSNRFKYSHIGSKLACEAVLKVVEGYLIDDNVDLLIENFKKEKIQLEIKYKWRDMVYEDFYKKNYKAYKLDYIQYGTTLSFVLLLKEYIVFFNLGDGGILIKKDENYEHVFKNNNYKIVNSLAQNRCEERMQYKILKLDENFQIVMFSDGFINSFDSYDKFKLELDKVFKILKKNVFAGINLKNTYLKYLTKLSKYGSLDDISVIFIY